MNELVLNELQDGIAELVGRAKERYLNCSDLTLEEAERIGGVLATFARDLGFWIGDLSRYTEARWPDTHHQCWPVFQSPGQLARNAGVCRAFPKPEDRQHACTFSQYMQVAGKPDRQKLLAEMVGLTTDESRKPGKDSSQPAEQSGQGSPQAARWLIAFDTHYFVHRHYYSGAGVETATQVSEWIQRTVERLKLKGASDVVCAFEGSGSFRKELTTSPEWENERYKDRPAKPEDLRHQLILTRDLIEKMGFCCVSVDGYEADDVLASYAKQFAGRVTIVSSDKDLRSCLSAKCNILLDVTWSEDDTSGDHMPHYMWLTSKTHTEATGITPELWGDFQCLAGDNVDGIRGVEGVGAKGAADLVNEFGTVEAVIHAAKLHTASITPKKREAIIAFEPKLEVTRQLVTLKTDLTVPNSTRIG